MTKTPGTKGKEILKHYNEVKVAVSHPMGQFMIHLCSHELGLSSNWSGWSGSSELVLGVVITSWGVVSLSINGCYAVESFAELRDSWKEEFKKACGTKVNGYKQVGSRGHIWGLVGDTILSNLTKGTENEGGTKRLEMIKYNPVFLWRAKAWIHADIEQWILTSISREITKRNVGWNMSKPSTGEHVTHWGPISIF